MHNHLILIRHAQPQITPTQPSHTWPLSEEGRHQCEVLAEQLRPHHPTRIITSTELKAQQTGQIVAARLGLPIGTSEGLQEQERSQVGYMDAAAFKTQIARLLTERDQLVFGQETGLQAQHRFTEAVIHLLDYYPNDTLALVTHGTIMTLFVSAFNDLDSVAFWCNLTLPDFLLLDNISFRLRSPSITP